MKRYTIATKETCPICKKGKIVQVHDRGTNILAQEHIEHIRSSCNNRRCGVMFSRPSFFKNMSKEKTKEFLKKHKPDK